MFDPILFPKGECWLPRGVQLAGSLLNAILFCRPMFVQLTGSMP